MFKLLFVSIFKPKKIIGYRAKKIIFMIVYTLLVSALCLVFDYLSTTNHKTLTTSDKYSICKTFEGSDAKLVNYEYVSSSSFTIELGGLSYTFIGSDASLENLPNNTSDFYIYNKAIYYHVSMLGQKLTRALPYTLESSSVEFSNVDLSTLTIDSSFFTGLNEIVKQYEKMSMLPTLIIGFIMSLGTMYGTALIAYLIFRLGFKADRYMKKKELFSILLYSTTLIALVSALNMYVYIGAWFYYLSIFISYFPFFAIFREIYRRIMFAKNGINIDDTKSVESFIEQLKNKLTNNDDGDDSDE